MQELFIASLFATLIVCLFVIWRMKRALRIQELITSDLQVENSEKRFEALVENGLDCVIIISPEGRTIYVSRSIKNILGYTREEVLDIDIRSVVHPNDISGADEALMRSIQNPGVPVQGYTSRVRHKNGSWRWIEPVITNLLHDPNVMGIVDNFRDVTDRIKAEDELKKTNERLLLATKGSKLGIWDQNLVTNAIIWDESMYKIYGVSKQLFSLNFENWLSLIHENDRIVLQQHIEKTIQNGNSLDLEFRIVHPDSSVRYIRSLAQVHRDDEGNAIRLIGTNLDITNSKDYEQTLEQILFDISHIIRKPVTNILGLSQLIDSESIEKHELQQIASYMKDSVKELDDFTISLSDSYQKKKMSAQAPSDDEN